VKAPTKGKKGELTEEPLTVPKKSKGKEPMKPVHTHPIGEDGDGCQVCDTYGNPLGAAGGGPVGAAGVGAKSGPGGPLAGRNPIEYRPNVLVAPVGAAGGRLLALPPREGLLEDCDDTTTNLNKRQKTLETGPEVDSAILRAQLMNMIAEDDGEDDEAEDGELDEE
jgi:hypothetical protein